MFKWRLYFGMFAAKGKVPGRNLDTVLKILFLSITQVSSLKIRSLNCKCIKIMNGKVLKQTHIFYNILLLLTSC